MDQVKIGNFIKELRKDKNLTQEQLAEQFNVARRTVSRWENGNNFPDIDILIEMSEFFDVDLREILDGERKEKGMTEEMKETVLKVAEYSNDEKAKHAKIVLVYFIVGLIGLAVNMAMDFMSLPSTFAVGFLNGMTWALGFGAMILGIIYITGVFGKVMSFKRRLLKKDK